MTQDNYSLFVTPACCLFAILPGFLCLVDASWPFLGCWTILSGLRWYYCDRKIGQDSFVFGVVGVVLLRRELVELLWVKWEELDSWGPLAKRVLRSSLLCSALLFAVEAVSRFCYRGKADSGKLDEESREDSIQSIPPPHLKPLLFPCQTTHARTFPKRHAFTYSYLLYGMPVIPPKTKRDGFDAGSQSDRIRGSWWLQVKADDYLVRGYGEMGFYGKLKMLLKEKGVTDCEWSYAYLVTAPRFLGYSFNPVSFWYIYDQSDQLNKMILEVNNTFGERRVYVLDGTSPATSLVSGSGALESDVGKLQFTDVWLKDFHVSPFNSRKGSYSLKALNPFPADVFTSPIIDNTITQKSSKAHAKIVARVYSTHQPLDPATLGIFGITKFALGWWWVGLSTFPRILKEAKTLYFRRQLNVWYRPEVLTSSISRIPTSTEMVLQEIFENYLKQLVWNAVEPLHVTYHTSIPSHPKEEIATMCTPGRDIPLKRIELRVLTPIFYSRFVHYAHTSEAFDREYLFTDEKNRTIWISNPELLHLLLPNRNTPTSEPESLGRQMSYLNELRWMLLRKLRCPPAESAYPTKPKPPSFEISNKPSLPFSDLDLFQRGPHGRLDSGIYRRTVMQVFLAQRLAFGFVEVVNGVDFLLRTLLCYIGARMLTTWALEAQANGFNRRLKLVEGTCIAELIGANTGRWWLFGLGLWVCSCNLYGLAKG